jgi:hypothetical protein
LHDPVSHLIPAISFLLATWSISEHLRATIVRGIAFARDSRAFIRELEPSWRFGKKIVRDQRPLTLTVDQFEAIIATLKEPYRATVYVV